MQHDFPAPLTCPTIRVLEDWIDYNGHMNVAYYVAAFDQGVDSVYDTLGIGEDYVREQAGSLFTRELRIGYVAELKLGDPIAMTFQLLDYDSKRLHFVMEMFHAEEGYLAATAEQLAIHVDMNERRSAAFPSAVSARLEALMASHTSLPTPSYLTEPIGIRRRSA
ncbi:MAG: thioesterase family protein [Pseudomonadaceae bacterium]|nr:thioesterase family protein [Pseudomonadaceae bacterium]